MKILKFLTVIIAMTSWSFASIAHTKLVSSEPDNESSISTAPKELKLTFNAKVKLMKVELATKKGSKVKLAFMLSPIASETFIIPLPLLTQDEYTVHWIAMGKDSHKMSGEFSFNFRTQNNELDTNR